MATVREIVREYLVANGYDGLWNDDCGCPLDDFMPCDPDWKFIGDCQPGHAKTWVEDGEVVSGIGPDDEWELTAKGRGEA